MNPLADTIAAISTPEGKSGIGIVRMSGFQALEIAEKFISSKAPLSSYSKRSKRTMILATLRDQSQQKIDEILVTIFPPHRAYTGEWTIELNCHGSIAIIRSALETVIHHGARHAKHGEFTQRAVMNGKMSLVKAEAIRELIENRDEIWLKHIWKQIDGGLEKYFENMREALLELIASIQCAIDFDEERSEEKNNWIKMSCDLSKQLNEIIMKSEKGDFIKKGCWVVIAGPPNAGKSSLFNAMLSYERAIVSDLPGTTRDHIWEPISISSTEVRLVDTAGLRETADPIEKLSLEKTKEQITTADVVLYTLDQNKEPDQEQKNEVYRYLENESNFIILNKSDLPSAKFYIEILDHPRVIQVSSIKKTGIEEVFLRIKMNINDMVPYENVIFLNSRQKEILKDTRSTLETANRLLYKNVIVLDYVYDLLNKARKRLMELSVVVSDEKILDSIFNNFCIGK